MNESAVKIYTDFILPPSVVSKIDVSRLVSEVEQVDNELTAIAVRKKTGATEVATPACSAQLTDFIEQNSISLDMSASRSELITQLRLLRDHAPVIHMTFAVVADPTSLQQIAQWLRSSVHPQVVVTAGLQPALVAGVFIRTTNKIHDLSLRAMLNRQHGSLVKELETFRGNR